MYKNSNFINLEKMFLTNKNSHSYIFYTNSFNECKNDVYNLICKIFNVNNVNLISSDFIIIPKSEKKNIFKEDMVELRNFFQKTSYINKNRLYLIEEAHKLNSSSANMILKFLEEPLNGIVAFFITDNLDNVLLTIKSRCQVINCFYDVNDYKINNECIAIIDDILSNNKYINIVTLKKKFEKYDRNQLINLFTDYLNYIYYDLSILDSKKVFLINKVIGMLNNNVNVDYIFDYLCIEGGSIK